MHTCPRLKKNLQQSLQLMLFFNCKEPYVGVSKWLQQFTGTILFAVKNNWIRRSPHKFAKKIAKQMGVAKTVHDMNNVRTVYIETLLLLLLRYESCFSLLRRFNTRILTLVYVRLTRRRRIVVAASISWYSRAPMIWDSQKTGINEIPEPFLVFYRGDDCRWLVFGNNERGFDPVF